MSTWDTLDKLEEAKRRSVQQNASDTLQRDVIARLQKLADETEGRGGNLAQTEEFMSTFIGWIEKAERSKFVDDMEIWMLLANTRQTIANPASMRLGLKKFHELRPEDLLLRGGEVDRNAAPKLVDEIYHHLNVGRGCRASMERTVARLEARLAYLLSVHGSDPEPPNEIAPAAMILEPQKKAEADNPTVIKEFDARVLR